MIEEQLLALEMKQRGLIDAIFPVFVGEVLASGNHANFFANKGLPACKEGVLVEAVEQKTREHLERKLGPDGGSSSKDNDDEEGGGMLRVPDRSPGGVLHVLKRHQGDFVQGNREESLHRIAHLICDMVKDVAAGRLNADAHATTMG